jgi:UDP-glucose 4-epimerase
MTEEFNLSDKAMFNGNKPLCFREDDVKEFIRLLKEELNDWKEIKDMCLTEWNVLEYKIDKLAGEELVKDYTRRDCFDHIIIRPSAVYGPLDVEDRVISKFILRAMRGHPLQVNGAQETLDFTYVDDAADGIVAAALSDNTDNKTYNITKSHSHSLLDAANLAVKVAGKGEIVVGSRDLDFPSRGALNIDAARRDFGFDPKVDVAEGFQNYYNWLKNDPYFGVDKH